MNRVQITVDDFHKYPRYTTTYIPAINWKLDYISLFKYLSIPVLPQAEAALFDTKKKALIKLSCPAGSVISVKYKDAYKVVQFRGYGSAKDKVGCFSNSATIVMYLDKFIVMKVPATGKIQITGCRTEDQVYKSVHHIWNHIQKIKKFHSAVSMIPDREVPRVIYSSAMNNININLGFNLNKRKVHEFLYKETEFSIIPNDSKYAGITAKLAVEGLEKLGLVRQRVLNGRWYSSNATRNDYLAMLNTKDRLKEQKSERYHTFLIFHSGKVIMSSPRYDMMESIFKYFVSVMTKNRHKIEDTSEEMVGRKKG